MKNLKRVSIWALFSIFLISMSACASISTNGNTSKKHPVFKVHPKNNGKKKGHDKHKHKDKDKGKKHKNEHQQHGKTYKF